MFGIGAPGPWRFATKSLASQVLWLWPLAVFGGIGAATRFRLRFPLGREHQQIVVWLMWAATMAAVFSYAKGITHSYYTLQMAPPLAALAGIGLTGLWTEAKRGAWRGWILPAVLLAQAAWTAYLVSDYDKWSRLLTPFLWSGLAAGTVALVIAQVASRWRPAQWIGAGGLALASLAILVSPAAWSITPCLAAASATQPSAGPTILGHAAGPMDFAHALEDAAPLIAYLQTHREKEKWLVATANTTEAAPLIVATGQPVMAIGGWQGAEPAIAQAVLETKIRNHELRYVLLSSFGPNAGGDARFQWIRDNATPVPRKRWHQEGASNFPRLAGRMGGSGLYDCRDVL